MNILGVFGNAVDFNTIAHESISLSKKTKAKKFSLSIEACYFFKYEDTVGVGLITRDEIVICYDFGLRDALYIYGKLGGEFPVDVTFVKDGNYYKLEK